MAKNIELLAAYWTISGADPHTDHEYSPYDFKERVAAVARVGFKGFGIWHADLEYTLQKYSLKDMKRILDDNGIKHVELEFLTGWFLDGEERRQSDILRQKLLEAADVLRPHHIKVGHFFKTQATMDRIIESFAKLCADGAEHGTPIAFEMMPFCDIDSVEKALQLVEGAGAKNGGLNLEFWHISKLRIPHEKIASIPQKYVVSVDINDGTWECSDPRADAITHRTFCGDGEFDVKGFIRTMLKAGYDGPWGTEVLDIEWRRKPLNEVVAKAFRSTIAQFPGQGRATASGKSAAKRTVKAKTARKTKKAKKAKKPKAKPPKRKTAKKSKGRKRRK
ncbi:MAG TPA: sugar phosphate isomerase/epimerase family protein [Verrucomicrobiae bacterium]|nr:sugar phosphate isomerase/epimerase family protein [Verrucomicrobiae bacterium]